MRGFACPTIGGDTSKQVNIINITVFILNV
jgi:hypothetical protein